MTVLVSPVHLVFHLLSAVQLIVISDEAQRRCVVLMLSDVSWDGPGAVMGHQGEQQGTQDATLRGVGAPRDDTGGIFRLLFFFSHAQNGVCW